MTLSGPGRSRSAHHKADTRKRIWIALRFWPFGEGGYKFWPDRLRSYSSYDILFRRATQDSASLGGWRRQLFSAIALVAS